MALFHRKLCEPQNAYFIKEHGTNVIKQTVQCNTPEGIEGTNGNPPLSQFRRFPSLSGDVQLLVLSPTPLQIII